MPDQTPAQELRIAAELLRHTAQRATHQRGGRWMRGTTANRSDVVLDHPDEPTVLIETFAERLEAVNAYLTLVGPATGAALADWLEQAARAHDATVIAADQVFGDDPRRDAWIVKQTDHAALAVARAILGGAS